MNASARTYSAPVVNEETRAYWDGANEGKLLLKRCTACSKTHFYPRVHCPHCQSSATEWYPRLLASASISTHDIVARL